MYLRWEASVDSKAKLRPLDQKGDAVKAAVKSLLPGSGSILKIILE